MLASPHASDSIESAFFSLRISYNELSLLGTDRTRGLLQLLSLRHHISTLDTTVPGKASLALQLPCKCLGAYLDPINIVYEKSSRIPVLLLIPANSVCFQYILSLLPSDSAITAG